MRFSKKIFFSILLILILLFIGETIRIRIRENAQTFELVKDVNPFANQNSKPVKGSLVPDFELINNQGSKIHIRDYRGKAVILNFWATWCAPCKLEMPIFQELTERRMDDVVVLAINKAEPVDKVNAFILDNKMTFPVLLDSDGKVAREFGIYAYPSTFFVDKEGIIQSLHTGQLNREMLTKYLKTIGIDSW